MQPHTNGRRVPVDPIDDISPREIALANELLARCGPQIATARRQIAAERKHLATARRWRNVRRQRLTRGRAPETRETIEYDWSTVSPQVLDWLCSGCPPQREYMRRQAEAARKNGA
jgi:hypothetical protein